VIIEKNNQLDDFLLENQNKDCFIIPILSDVNLHPLQNSLSAIYVKIVDGEERILCFNHGETLKLNSKKLLDLDKLGRKFVRDKKQLNHIVKLNDVVDVNLQYYMSKNEPLEWEELSTNTHDYFHRVMWKMKNTNRIIPILKHLELCREQVMMLEKHYKLPIHEEYNNQIIENLSFIESSGLRKDDDMVFSEYNLFTSTGRPSNRFGGINFAALNKKDESRKPYKSRFQDGILVEFDYDAYHLRLIGHILDYQFPKGSVHEHMSEFYGNVDYETSKSTSFQYLYGRIPQQVIDTNPFFSRVNKYINEIWGEFKREDFVKSNIYNKRIYKKNLSAMNRNKLFNYMIQLLETENNMKVMTQLIPFLKDKQSKLILYSYDSFLFDFKLTDGLDFLKSVKQILEQDGVFPTKSSKGLNYHEMKDITEKL
tara:strand:- start:5256 stop:6530 length:1275 start_codon:yes stop_codon:yes gene_type:complete